MHKQTYRQLLALLEQLPTEATMNSALRLLAKYRSALLRNTLIKLHGTKVMQGPFAGMDYIERSTEGCHVPKLLGCYEEELHPFLCSLPDAGYSTVINIGCAEGYYAVGIKRLLPGVRVLAYDTNPAAREACKTLAKLNGIDLEIGGLFKPADFANFIGKDRTLLWCDIEGAEDDLLDPVTSPALEQMDLVVEFHKTRKGHTINDVPSRFVNTHDIEIIHARGHNPRLPPFLQALGHLDQLLAQWEWRSAPTPWAVMRAKK